MLDRISAAPCPFHMRGVSIRPGRGHVGTGYTGGPRGSADPPLSPYVGRRWFVSHLGGLVSTGPGSRRHWVCCGSPGGTWGVPRGQWPVSRLPLVRFACGGSRFDRAGVTQALGMLGVTGVYLGGPQGSAACISAAPRPFRMWRVSFRLGVTGGYLGGPWGGMGGPWWATEAPGDPPFLGGTGGP